MPTKNGCRDDGVHVLLIPIEALVQTSSISGDQSKPKERRICLQNPISAAFRILRPNTVGWSSDLIPEVLGSIADNGDEVGKCLQRST